MSESGTIEAAKVGVARSPHWPTVERHFIESHPACAACGVTKGVQAHHVAPFHFCILVGRPDLELDPRNLVSLSESEKCLTEVNYHLLLGHADNFQSSNLLVVSDIPRFYGKIEEQIRADEVWRDRVRTRCKPWHEWTDQNKADFRAMLDEKYPLPEGVTPEMALVALVPHH
jgi:hypothetical protein